MPKGGARPGAGRPRRVDEEELIVRLKQYDELFFEKLQEGLEANKYPYIRLFCEYRFGKPQERVDVTTNGESVTTVRILDVDGTEF